MNILMTMILVLIIPTIAIAAKENNLKGFIGNIDETTVSNSYYRHVLYTGKNLQLVLMSINVGEDIGEEVHHNIDQFFRIEAGSGHVLINGKKRNIKADDAILIPAGAKHNIINSGNSPLKFYTLYGPPEHRDGIIHKRKGDAKTSKKHFDGKTTETYEGK